MPDYRRKPLCSIAPLFLIDGVINLILCSFSLSATGERGPTCLGGGRTFCGCGWQRTRKRRIATLSGTEAEDCARFG
ncbi:hypothetical protein PXH59_04345 [Xenorhabdus sp. SF857]|uniref:hypothetical protein n=1 Tax=Xenorhabdus bakwenae TaxID=3026967 RepID=UPI0025583565|nr:hypothetical protein [Xenorhabdus sp. SF857]WFQ80392.1 hypothetical protein PXH59_04345 [Xenorhabdus sp. SF857]